MSSEVCARTLWNLDMNVHQEVLGKATRFEEHWLSEDGECVAQEKASTRVFSLSARSSVACQFRQNFGRAKFLQNG